MTRGNYRLIGNDVRFCEQIAIARAAAKTGASLLILGETGTGKDVLARAIHEWSERPGRFVAVNCAGFPSDLLQSELFGYMKGAFSGADKAHTGLFAAADRGTLFLDEIGDLPPEQQPQLLRALESQSIRPVGSSQEVAVTARVIAATHSDAVEGEMFRSDLFFRISTVVVELPPLRERVCDIPLLANFFLGELRKEVGERELSAEFLQALSEYPWPGNVRELRQMVYRAAIFFNDRVIRRFHGLLGRRSKEIVVPRASFHNNTDTANSNTEVAQAYRMHGSIRKGARAMGVPKSTFADRLLRLKKTP